MSTSGNEDSATSSHGEGRWFDRVKKHIAKEWPSALLVVSLVTVAHHHAYWVKAFEAYTFLTISQLTSVGSAHGPDDRHRAAVVLIDELAFETRFNEQSPLNRCEIAKNLLAIYSARPDVVVVDLDLSPARWDDTRTKCEDLLFTVLRREASRRVDPVKTVLLEPFEPADKDLAAQRKRWREHMLAYGDDHIVFAIGDLPVGYGVHAIPSSEKNSIARTVARLSRADGRISEMLDPRQLLKGIRVLNSSEFPPGALDPDKFNPDELDPAKLDPGKLGEALTKLLPETMKHNPGGAKVVFLGAGFGAGDVFLTAVGEIYGVEAHAAAYVSDPIERSELIGFVLDFTIALGLGLAIAFFWRKYFDARLSDDAFTRQVSKLWILGLVLTVALLVVVLSLLSLVLLMSFGWWLSPLPIAIGMLIDSFVSGSVDQATHKFVEMRRALIGQSPPPAAVAVDVHGSFVSTAMNLDTRELVITEGTVSSRAEFIADQLLDARAVAPPGQGLLWGARHLPSALGGELCQLLIDRKSGAAVLLCLWTAIWLSFALSALISIWP